jgi:hypothetical protein
MAGPVHSDTASGQLTPEELYDLWPEISIIPNPDDPPEPGSPSEPPPQSDGPATEPETPTSPTLEQREAAAKAERAAVEQEIAALLKTAVNVPAVPPLGVACEEDAVVQDLTAHVLRAWVQEASEPEASLLARLWTARRALQSLGVDDASSYAVEAQLVERLAAKAHAIMKANAKNRDAIPAVIGFVRGVARLSGSLGQSDTESELISALAAWLAPFVPGMLKDLREDHDYAMVIAVLRLLGQINALGLETGSGHLEDALSKITAAMTFALTLDYRFTVTGANGNVESFHLQASFPVRFEIGGGEKDVRAMLAGEGTGSYLSYTESDGRLRMQAQSFPVGAKIESFDPCAGTAQLFLDRFYAEAETYIFSDGTTADLNMAEVSFMVSYEKNRGPDGWLFDIPVTNRQKMVVETTIAGGQGTFAGTLQVTLDHQPN